MWRIPMVPCIALNPRRHLKFEVEKKFLNCSFGGWEVGRSRFSIKKIHGNAKGWISWQRWIYSMPWLSPNFSGVYTSSLDFLRSSVTSLAGTEPLLPIMLQYTIDHWEETKETTHLPKRVETSETEPGQRPGNHHIHTTWLWEKLNEFRNSSSKPSDVSVLAERSYSSIRYGLHQGWNSAWASFSTCPRRLQQSLMPRQCCRVCIRQCPLQKLALT